MKTAWDYTELAAAYVKRPDYADEAIDLMLGAAGIAPGASVCDVGAGVAHLSLNLAARRVNVVAVEPNEAMRALGLRRTRDFPNVQWHEGTGERTGQPAAAFDLVTFGSSFNVTDRAAALRETARILKPRGWFAAMWNHRDLADPIQRRIENVIHAAIPEYDYGTRREDQTAVIDESGMFGMVRKIEGQVVHVQTVPEIVEAWRSHATLRRQAGDRFRDIIADIEKLLRDIGQTETCVPYTTRIWMAQMK